MAAYLIKRLLLMLLTLAGTSVLIFVLLWLMPGNIAVIMFDSAGFIDPDEMAGIEKELGLDPEKTNVNGGAIALTHPLAASGSRITIHLLHELKRRGGKYALGSACIGGGQGGAVIVEAL